MGKRRPPEILRKSHAHVERKERAEAKAALKRKLGDELVATQERGLLIDLDGVVYAGNEPIAGAADAIAWLVDRQVPRLFLTNTTSIPRAAIARKLAGFGVLIRESEILTPPIAARRWLEHNVDGSVALFVPDVTRSEFEGLTLARTGEPVAAVVVGDYGEQWTFSALNRAFRLLMSEPRPVLVALGMTRYWQAPDGLRLDTAPFVTALACASGVEPIVLGKPAPAFFAAALEELALEPGRAWMVGDDIRVDVKGAQDAGLRGVLVRTGKFRSGDLGLGIEPAVTLGSIAELPDWWMTVSSA